MPIIDNRIHQECHKYLRKNKALMKEIHVKRGVTEETINRFEIGYDIKSDRYTIPVKNSMDQCVNIRKWSDRKDPKIISYDKGYGENRIYPIENLKDQSKRNIIVCEGEWDAIVANQYGYNAVTGTCGVSSWNSEWNNYFIGKNVIIIFDCDSIGQKAAKKLSQDLMSFANAIKIVNLELDNGEDITDWFVRHNKDKKELDNAIKATGEEDVYDMVDLVDSMNPKHYDKKIKFNGVVVGKDTSPYIIPKKIVASCTGGTSKKCELCPLQSVEEIKVDYDYDTHKASLVSMINASDTQVMGIIKHDLRLPKSDRCRQVRIKIEECQKVEDINVIPDVCEERINEEEYVTRRAFVFNDIAKTNQVYLFKGTTWKDPKNQMGIHLVSKIKSTKDSIHKFIFDADIKNKLKIFQPEDPEHDDSIWEKLRDYCTDISYNVTKVYNRSSIVIATDLLYHSALSFKFCGIPLTKSWLEFACIGDTGTGKSETIKKLVKHYHAGEYLSSGENTTVAGLIGGIQQINGRNTMTWGKLALNDGGALIVDEADNLVERGIMAQLSGVRSSGVAEIVKIQGGKTHARTRPIWVANPLKGRVNQYSYGIEIVTELFGKQQDIRRLDFVIIVSKDEVSKSVINKMHNEKYPHTYTEDLCHARVMWAWNRRCEDIIWEKGTEKLVLEMANILSDKYSSDIPLVLGAEIRMKIARMSVAMAIMMYSTDEECEKVIVKPAHVRTVCKFLQKQYDSPACGYLLYSKRKLQSESNLNHDMIDEHLSDIDIVNTLLDTDKMTVLDIEEIFAINKEDAKDQLKCLRKYGALTKHSNSYKKTSAFISYLKKKQIELNAGSMF